MGRGGGRYEHAAAKLQMLLAVGRDTLAGQYDASQIQRIRRRQIDDLAIALAQKIKFPLPIASHGKNVNIVANYV